MYYVSINTNSKLVGHLKREEDDGDNSDPRVKGVEIWLLRVAVVVEAEDGHQAKHGKHKRADHHGRVGQLQLLLLFIAKHPVHQHSCKRQETKIYYIDPYVNPRSLLTWLQNYH